MISEHLPHEEDYGPLSLFNHCRGTKEITNDPDFYLLTSLLWIRTPSSAFLPQQNIDETQGRLSAYTEKTKVCEHEPDLGLLRLHSNRLAAAAEAIAWRHLDFLSSSDVALQTLKTEIALHLQSLLAVPEGQVERRKLRVTLAKTGDINVDSSVIDCHSMNVQALRPFMPATLDMSAFEENMVKPPVCQVLVDTQPTQPSVFTTHKTSYRMCYNAARARKGITKIAPNDKEVLMYNKNGQIMETSLCTIYFNRDEDWVTPATICGGNLAVTRRLALQNGLCKQGCVEVSEVQDGERVWLSNGVRGFFVGQICLKPGPDNMIPENVFSPRTTQAEPRRN